MSQVSIIDIEGNHPQIPTQFDANVGFAIPIGNLLEILGEAVVAGAVPVQTVGSGNTITTQVQISQAIASTNSANVGLAAFNSADFSVDANGFVSILGSAATQSVDVDTSTPPGTDPVVPNGSGIIIATGGQVAAGSTANVIRTNSLAANSYTIQIQRSSAQAVSTLGANGVAHFNSSQFTVDGNGYVALTGPGQAIDSFTTDVSGPISPDGAGNVAFTGATNIFSDGSVANTMRLNLQGTNHALFVGRGANTTSAQLGVGTNGQVLIAATGADSAFSTLTSSDSSITFTTGVNSLSLQVAGGTTVGKTITGDTGGALSPTAGNWNLLGSGSITTAGSGSTLTTQLTGLTNHAILVGAGTTTITKVGPSATAGQVFQSGGSSADPLFSTATYPSVATGTGTILRADGTNWAATTATYPATTTVSQLLYSSSTNVVSGLSTANNGVLTTNGSGVPSIDTTNFQVLTTGVQMKGNNANTAPPAGFIGEQIRATSTLASGSVSLVNNITTNVLSINLSAGIWDISGVVAVNANGATWTRYQGGISTTSATIGTQGDNFGDGPIPLNAIRDSLITIPSWRLLTTGASTTVYLVAVATVTVANGAGYGRISATRVG
jgi:hypothetical protein